MKNLVYVSKVYLGQIVNLIAGMSPDAKVPFSKVMKEGTDEIVNDILKKNSTEDCYFGLFPVLVPCSKWSDLVEAFYSRFNINGRSKKIAGAAILQKYSIDSSKIPSNLAKYLGIDKKYADDNSGFGFVLAKVKRNMQEAVMSFSDLQQSSFKDNLINDYKKKINIIEASFDKSESGDILNTPDNITKILDSINDQLGSHYVESVQIGDEAYQVFVYTNENFKMISDAMDKSGWKNEKSLGFRYFTSKKYCEFVGEVRLLSGDSKFDDVRKFLADSTYNLKESIFSLVLSQQAQTMAQELNSTVCVGASLSPISQLRTININNPEMLTSTLEATKDTVTSNSLLDSITIQACITHFGAEGAGPAAITGSTNTDYSKLYAAFGQMDTLSMLWSPYLSISQMYVCLDELWKMPVVNKTGVKHLLITADVIEINNDIDLSSAETVTFACRLLITGRNGNVPTINLSSSACNPLRLYCGSMMGSCVFEEKDNHGKHQLIFDSFAASFTPSEGSVSYKEFFSGRFPVDPFYDTSNNVNSNWRKIALQSGLETLLMSASAILTPQAMISDSLKQTAMESWNCLKWISDSTKKVVDEAQKIGTKAPEDLAWIYAHSVMQLRTVVDPHDTTASMLPQVPTLRYTAYEDAVNKLLDVAKEYSRQIDNSSRAINEYNQQIEKSYIDSQRDENIKKLSQLMLQQNQAIGSYEDDLTQSHNEIINKKQETILQLKQRETQLRQQYNDYLNKLTTAKDAMVEAIAKKKREEETKAVFNVIFGVVEAFTGIMTGVYGFKTLGDAVDAERILKKFEAFMKLAEQANKLIDIGGGLAEHIETISDLDSSIPADFTQPPTDLEWDIFLNDSEAHVKPAEKYIMKEVAEYEAAVKNLTAIAKSLNSVLDQKSQFQYDIFAENSSKKVSQNQSQRLRSLSISLNDPKWTPDIDYLSDLGQFNAVLRQKQNSALIKLAEMVMLQDNSMTYYYLSKPTIITQFDIASIQEGLVSQALSAVQTLETYPYPPTDLQEPLQIKIDNIPVSQLTSNMGVEVQVQINQGLFNSLSHVRINSIDVRIDGVSTNTGKCHVQIETLGNPMLDRGLKRETISYQMISREWHVVYDTQNGKTIIGTKPAKEWGQYFTKPTPFQTYRISIPNSAENEGVEFKSQFTSITLSFMLEAAYSKPSIKTVLKSPLPMSSENNFMDLTASNTDPSSFFELLKGVSVTDGWDVVSFVSVDKINNLWKQRWDSEVSGSFKGDAMFIQEINVSYKQLLPGKITVEYQLNVKTGSPWLKFVADSNQSAVINIPIINGTMTTSTYDKNGKQIGQDTEDIKTSVDKPVLIKTKAALKKLQGEVDMSTVYIDPAQDTFALENIEINPQVDVGICNEIVEYFKKHKLEPWKLGTLRLNSDVDFLRPKIFNFQTYTPPNTHSKDWPAVLAIYVLTTTPDPPNHGMRITWHEGSWPVNSDYDAAVYFSCDLLWNKEILPTVKEQIGDADVINNAITNEYYVQLKGTEIVSKEPVEIVNGWNPGTCYTVTELAKVNFPLSAVKLEFNLLDLKLSCDEEWNERFPYQGKHSGRNPDPYVHYTTLWDNVTFTCSFDSTSHTHINYDTFDVTFDPLNVSPKVYANYDEHKFWGLPINRIEQSVVDYATANIVDKISGFQLNLKTMPMFAVSNLLFPESKAIDPKFIYCPHDLVIVGNVVHDWKELK